MNNHLPAIRLRRMISHLKLPVSLNIFLFGFANRPLFERHVPIVDEKTAREAAEKPRKTEDTPGNRVSVDSISLALDMWVGSMPDLRYEFSLEQLADSINVCKNELLRYFQMYLHMDFRVWKSRLRLERAALMLLEYPSMMISDICKDVGMPNVSNFHRQFRKYKNCTPKQWRLGRT
ncbi:MAG: helix-turn-helix domain-containing protein [Bacteroidales bacterium]|nr:helix-turn-helix domain-containing protein [Bacteroidales bacterium]